jgi:uncharacterized membrane protein YgdD (TMEM256/DUF423 family)|tara:strand:+ start:1346 stop:1735 length:390 start_codon:yes stop_codon:yes gene_type:complete
MMRSFLLLAAFSGFTAVLFGAMGSHFLSPYMTEKGPALFRTANLYHLVHSLALLGCALLVPLCDKSAQALKYLKLSAGAFLLGLILFSGMVYYVALSPSPLHFLIPLGGLSFMTGWALLAATALSLSRP